MHARAHAHVASEKLGRARKRQNLVAMVSSGLAKRHQAAELKAKNPPWRMRKGTARNVQLRGDIKRRTAVTTRLTARLVEHKVDEIGALIAALIRSSKGKTVGLKHVRYALSQNNYKRFIPSTIGNTKLRVKKIKRGKRVKSGEAAPAATAAPAKKPAVTKKVASKKAEAEAAAVEPAVAEPAAEAAAQEPAAGSDEVMDADVVPE